MPSLVIACTREIIVLFQYANKDASVHWIVVGCGLSKTCVLHLWRNLAQFSKHMFLQFCIVTAYCEHQTSAASTSKLGLTVIIRSDRLLWSMKPERRNFLG